MTAHKHLKQLVRARMASTGESYAAARRHVVASAASSHPVHFAGSVPAATALRVLLAHAGVRAPHDRRPFSEAMTFGLGGGIGAGVFAFHYDAADFSSFYVAGRHLWEDDVAWFDAAVRRLGARARIRETGGGRQADRELRDALAAGPAAVWVDLAHLPYRALPAEWSGGGYHVLVVYEIAGDDAVVGDLTDEPIRLPLEHLAMARARIRKQKNRVLTLEHHGASLDLRDAVHDALRACHGRLLRGRSRNFTIDAFRVWADRLHGDAGADSWAKVFRRGRPLWQGIRSVCDFIEYYGTGGGLCRPLFSEFLSEAADALEEPRLRALADRYRALGELWSDLAAAALPDEVPELAETRRLLTRKAELHHSRSDGAEDEIRQVWADLDDVGRRVADRFPLDERATGELLLGLQNRVRRLHDEEAAAAAQLAAALDPVTAGPTTA